MPLLQNEDAVSRAAVETSPPPCLLASNPLQWLRIFGPGAVVASLTIGAGELIFSTRGGALFGFNILGLFLLTLVMKWVLAYSIARHIVISGYHPFQRWNEGAFGALPTIFLVLAMVSFPVWTAFHAGTVGTLLSTLTGSALTAGEGVHLVWGIALLILFGAVSLRGGYATLEKVQFGIVALLLVAVLVAAVKLRPDWTAVLSGMFFPKGLEYPDWISSFPAVAARTPALECITYIGVLGGSSYDYLAYASYLRDKKWGSAGNMTSAGSLFDRRWLRAPLIDCTMSFVAVLLFTVVFVICGVLILGPRQQLPEGSNLLTLQAQFVTPLFPQLRHLYFAGALLAMAGTLYGTIEVAPTIAREFLVAQKSNRSAAKARRFAIIWVCSGGIVILLLMLLYSQIGRGQSPPALLSLLTPANLFTGVLGCGLICLTTPLAESRIHPSLRAPRTLLALNLLFGLVFLLLGLRAYWDHGRWNAFLLLTLTIGIGWLAHQLFTKRP